MPEFHTIRFSNQSKSKIVSEDYRKPLKITVPNDIRLLAAEIVEFSGSDEELVAAKAAMAEGGRSVVVGAVVLGRRHWLDVRILTDRDRREFDIPRGLRGILAIENRVEAWRYSEIAIVSRFVITGELRDETRSVQSSSIDVSSLVWQAIPRVTLKRIGAAIPISAALMVFTISLAGWMSPVAALSLFARVAVFVVLLVAVMAAAVGAVAIPIVLISYIARKMFYSLVRRLVGPRR